MTSKLSRSLSTQFQQQRIDQIELFTMCVPIDPACQTFSFEISAQISRTVASLFGNSLPPTANNESHNLVQLRFDLAPQYSRNECITMVRFLLLSSLTFFTISMTSVESHGGLVSPRSRNQVAREEGTNGAQSGVPKKEYCWHCLNRNNGMCGKIDGNDYDAWLDSTGKPMPWKPQATYQRGQVITVKAEIPANHWGHMELRACPKGRQSTQGCLDSYPLEFVQDVSYGTPKDPSYPERGYLVDRKINYTMKFRLPSNLVGEQVLLQV